MKLGKSIGIFGSGSSKGGTTIDGACGRRHVIISGTNVEETGNRTADYMFLNLFQGECGGLGHDDGVE